jgi:hypothetical protein
MPLAMQGTWTVSVKTKNAAFPQRFTIAGATSGNGSHVVGSSTPPVVVTGTHWTIHIEAQDGSVWKPSAMRFKTPVTSSGGAIVSVDIESDDGGGGGDEDFDDLILTCSMSASSSDFLLYGHASAYSANCVYNPCWRWALVIDSFAQLQVAVKNSAVLAAIQKLYPEVLKPGPKNPGDPAPMRTFTPLILPTPRSPSLPPPVKRSALRAAEGQAETRSLAVGASATALLDPALTLKLGHVLDGIERLPLRCRTTTLGNYGLRFQEYDRTAAELGGAAYTGTGNRDDLGTTATDAFGNYVFRFTRSLGDVIDEAFNDVGAGEDPNVQALPDVIAQVLGAGSVPAAETACHFNVRNVHRLDICVPDTNIVLPSSCVDNRILTFIGKISLTSSLNTLDGSGRITALSTAGNAPQIQCGVWWGNLDLWGCFGNPTIAAYTVRTRPLGGDSSSWQFHAFEERREIGGGSSKKIGPFFELPLAVPFDPTSAKVTCPRYLNAEIDPSIVQPGAFLKATLRSGTLATGSHEVRIDCYNAAGDFLKGESMVLFVDNQVPLVDIDAITLAGQPVIIGGTGCTLQTLSPAELSADLDVRFKVDHTNGAILNYALTVARCNEGAAFPVNYVSGGLPSFTWVHDTSVDCETPPNFRQGTIEDPDNDGSGYVTTTLSPVTPWLGASENFTIMRVSIGYNWRATDGYANASGTTFGPLVWGIQK